MKRINIVIAASLIVLLAQPSGVAARGSATCAFVVSGQAVTLTASGLKASVLGIDFFGTDLGTTHSDVTNANPLLIEAVPAGTYGDAYVYTEDGSKPYQVAWCSFAT